jgi:redox-sensitive bicupin YhaK (pirin superfamily)
MSVPRQRTLSRVISLPAPAQGQFGPDHTVIEVIRPQQWPEADPFILLMDDRVDGKLRAGPHPHAGFETVTYIVEGNLPSESGAGSLSSGDVEWTTAGSGIVHGPSAPMEGKMRVLQLWLTLPKASRWTEPDHQLIRAAEALTWHGEGAQVRLYSGKLGTLRSTTRNHVPVTLLELQLQPGATFEQVLPLRHNGFFYVLEGSVRIGPEGMDLRPGQVGWLDRHEDAGEGALRVSNPSAGLARVLFYSGERQEVPLVSYGPFIGDTQQDIVRSFERYQTGSFRRY